MLMIATLAIYFLVLLGIAHWVSGRKHQTSNAAFYRASQRAPWAMVAFGMIAGSISGVSFVSVPAWVGKSGMSYLQMCMGFFF